MADYLFYLKGRNGEKESERAKKDREKKDT